MKLIYAVRDRQWNLYSKRFDSAAKAIKFARKVNTETQLDDEIEELYKNDCTIELIY